jgi:predicted nucleic acid-binding protein
LDAEPGVKVVEAILEEKSCRCLIHVLNVCEIYYHVLRRADKKQAAKLPALLESYGFELVDSLPRALWQDASNLKAEWRRVSLADCFALALAIRRKATLVTSDHHEFDPVAQAGLCPIRFIR